jgi:signal transduction histidine kinase
MAGSVGVAAGVLVATLAILAAGGFGTPDPATRHLDALGVILSVVSTAPLALRSFAPFIVYLVSAAGSVALLWLGYPLDAPVAAAVAAYALAVAYSRRWAMLAVYAFVPAVALAYAAHGIRIWYIGTELLAWEAVFAGIWIAGDRSRRLASQVRQERQLAAATERTRIARELHDSAGHAINVILVQAGAARLLHERNPAGSQAAIATIEQVARDTIGDIDRMVRALREDGGPDDVPADPAALGELLERHRAGGLAITSAVDDGGPALPRSVAWAAYRILQESLTNAARHGDGTAEVSVRFRPRCVEIDVVNPAGPSSTPSGGHGIVGMRERATLLGGTLDTSLAHGCFRLSAVLPHTSS